LDEYDYSQPGHYFVTLCTKDRTHWFGEIKDGEIVLNEYGSILQKQWNWLPEQYPYVELDVFAVMPNHFHGVIAIVGDGCIVGGGRDRPLRKTKPLPELIGAFKTTSSKLIHQAGGNEFHWQRSFYDHIVRDELSLNRIREYIVNNPAQWDSDVENTQNVRAEDDAYYVHGAARTQAPPHWVSKGLT